MADPALAPFMMGSAFAFIMVLCRTGAAIMLLPAFSDDGPPPMLRTGPALALTLLLLPAIAPRLPALPTDMGHLAALLANELLAGGLLGWFARLIYLSLPAAGQIIALSTGHSSILQPDANFGSQTSGLGQLFGRLSPVLIMGSGLYALPLSALSGSYDALPPGPLPNTADLTELAVRAAGSHFALALQLAAPFILVGMIWQVALGLLARLVPHIQLHFATLPGQLLGGLLVLSLLASKLAAFWLASVAHVYAHLPGA